MTRAGVTALVAIALAAGLALRVARLDVRPMHHDEANQAVKFGALLERGEYRYDAHDHHGPTLYYLTLPSAWLRGQHTLASLDERTLRAVPALFGATTILLIPLLSGSIGRTPVAVAAILMALSPAMVFYSRMFIQEALFACFTLAFAIALGHVLSGGDRGWTYLAGLSAGLALATKETSVIALPAAVVAGRIASWSLGAERRRDLLIHGWPATLLAGVGTTVAVAVLFYSSFLSAPTGILEPFRGALTYLDRGIDPATHDHPWHYYVGLLAYSSSGGLRWSEGLVLVLAIVGAMMAWRRPDRVHVAGVFWARYVTCTAVITAATFSAIPYKTPWNLLPFYVSTIVLAGLGFAALVDSSRSRVVRGALAAAFALASVQLGWQAWRAAVTYAADPRNPYVYAQTVPDHVRMAARIRNLSALHRDGSQMLIAVIASPHEQWPLPWYLRIMPNVGYWSAPGDALPLGAPVIVSSIEHTPVLDQALRDGYVSELYGLRPDVLLALYIERGLWDRFLATAASTSSAAGGLAAAGVTPVQSVAGPDTAVVSRKAAIDP